jgi:hypothetical protein
MNRCRLFFFALAALVSCQASRAADDAQGYKKISFGVLASFAISPPPGPASGSANVDSQIPARIKAWQGRKVIVTGYMLPVKTEKGRVTELLLTPNTMAAGNLNAFAVNEWVVVKIPAGVLPQTLHLVSFYGTLKVAPLFEQGFLTGIYELAADRMSEIPVL